MLNLSLKRVDARGRSCPEPVLLTKKAIDANPDGVIILVDNTTARDNITRFAGNTGYSVSVERKGPDFVLTVKR
jgi:tRNA 2-thiouridine synthesizing protein A